MQKWLSLILVLMISLAGGSLVSAQGGGTLELDQWIEGELSTSDCVHTYTFQGAAGQLMLIEGLARPGTYDLDPAVVLADSAGNVVASNDDGMGLNALIALELPAEDEYSVTIIPGGLYLMQNDTTAPLSNWALDCSPDDSYGAYSLRVRAVEPMVPGSSAEAAVYSVAEKDLPNIFVFRPDSSVTWGISFTQPESELHAQFQMTKMPEGDMVFDLGETNGLRSGTLNVALEGGAVYVLVVNQSFFSFVFDDMSIPITINVTEAQ